MAWLESEGIGERKVNYPPTRLGCQPPALLGLPHSGHLL